MKKNSITIKVYKPIKSRLMGSRSMKGTTLCQIPKEAHAACYRDMWFDNVPELVRAIFNDLNILGAEIKINEEKMNYADACSFEINSVYMIQIYLTEHVSRNVNPVQIAKQLK